MWLDQYLNAVEALAFDREDFPKYYNGHRIIVLHNDARVTEDRLYVHLGLYCTRCEKDAILRGRGERGLVSPKYMATAKLAVFGELALSECT